MPDLTNSSGFSHLIKTFGGAKVVSTVMGMLLLAGGVGAGVALVMQPQETASIAYLLEPPLQYCDTSDIVCSMGQLTNGAFCQDKVTSVEKWCCPQGYSLSGSTCVAPASAGICSPSNAGTTTGCDEGYRCSILGTCETNIGVGNCAIHSGNCYVHSSIGIEDTPGDNTTRDVCDYGGHWTTCEVGYVCSNYDCIPGPGGTPNPTKTPGTGEEPKPTPTPTLPPTKPPVPTPTPTVKPTATPTPTATPVAVCSAETIYTPNWTLISATTFQTLPVGGQVYFCVNGTTSAGAFDMARFTINNTLRPEVTLRRPGFSDICDLYTIPANTYTFTVQGEIHHTTLGWR